MITRIKGTQDFLDLSLYHYILEKAQKHLQLYHFKEISTPLIEPMELFKRSLGLQTDVVSKEMYSVVADSGAGEHKEALCLRPELTASIMRAFVNGGITQTPWKVFSVGPAFRHERPQKGRYRQFHQLSIEVLGSQAVAQDVLFIKMLDAFFSTVLNIQEYALLINYLGNRQDRIEHQKVLKLFLEQQQHALCALCSQRMHTNIMRVFDCKQQTCQDIYVGAPTIIDTMSQESVLEWQELKHNLEQLGVSYSIQPTLVRGLDYYNKTVFEFVSVSADGLGAQNTFCGGGRYDSLATEIGAATDVPSIGAAIGMERLQLLLESAGMPAVPAEKTCAVVIPFDTEQQPLGLHIVNELHTHGLCADILLDKKSIKQKFKAAHAMGATWAILIGADEQQSGTATVKNMMTGSEERINQADIVTYLQAQTR